VSPDAGTDGATSGSTCSGDPTLCLSGTLTATAFTASSQGAVVQLFAVFPGQNQPPTAKQPLLLGQSWAFSQLSPGVDYFLQALVAFDQVNVVSRVVGPFRVPADGGAIAIDLLPVAFNVLEVQAGDAAPVLETAYATLFDPASGAPIQDGGSVVMSFADASVALALDTDAGVFSYAAPAQTLAPPTYTVTVTPPGAAATPATWPLVASLPSGVATIGSIAEVPPAAPLDGGTIGPVISGDGLLDASIAGDGSVLATFSGPPDTDYVQVELFEQEGGAWASRYQSARPEAPSTTSEVVGASHLASPGVYLLDVLYTKASCPIGAAGCVQTAAAASEEFTVVATPDGG
jgi:hypothetical protein